MKIIRPMSPLRRRMLEDMQIRNYSPHTIDGYLRYAAQFANHFGTSPDRLGAEHIRTYQLHLLQQHASKSIFLQTVCALRFLDETTLGRPRSRGCIHLAAADLLPLFDVLPVGTLVWIAEH